MFPEPQCGKQHPPPLPRPPKRRKTTTSNSFFPQVRHPPKSPKRPWFRTRKTRYAKSSGPRGPGAPGPVPPSPGQARPRPPGVVFDVRVELFLKMSWGGGNKLEMAFTQRMFRPFGWLPRNEGPGAAPQMLHNPLSPYKYAVTQGASDPFHQ